MVKGWSRSQQRDLLISASLFFLWLIFTAIRIDQPPVLYFDEQFYVSAGLQFLKHGNNENWSHPPLGKLLIGLGVALFGERPLGWRFASMAFGSLTLSGMYLWGRVLFGSVRAGLLVAGLCALNQLLYVQSRIAMLDTFMFGFSVLGMASFTKAWLAKKSESLLLLMLSGAMFGFAAACKWIAFTAWAVCLGLWISKNFRKKTKPWRELWLGFVLAPLAAYFLSYVPILGMVHPTYAPPLTQTQPQAPAPIHPPKPSEHYGVLDVFKVQLDMLHAQVGLPERALEYQSRWWKWPLLLRPIWYCFSSFEIEHPPSTNFFAVILLGNPLIMWGGLLAMLFCLALAIRKPEPRTVMMVAFYLASTAIWAVLPRKGSFYYYYYPAGMSLSLALVEVYQRFRNKYARGAGLAFFAASLALFIYFFPILSFSALPLDGLRNKIWFNGWN